MAAPETPRPFRNRRRTALIAALAIGLLLAFALRWVSQPSRVAGLILAQTGKALGLEITASGASEYRLRGTPMLEIRDVVARQAGATTALLRAERIFLEVPWATLRARGDDLTVRRIELDAPQLDLAALQRWQATRPPAETRVPTLTDGLRVVRGRVLGDGWSLQALDLDLPALHPERPVRARVRGQAIAGTTRVPFDVHAALTRAAARAGFGVHGTVTIESRAADTAGPPALSWALPMRATLSGRLHDGDDGIGFDRTRVAATARYRSGDTDLPFAFGLAAPLRFRAGTLQLAPLGVAVRGRDAIPNLDAHGRLTLDDALALQLDGRLASWPQAWPALPPPLDQSTAPLPFALDYRGRSDLSDVSTLRLQRDSTRFDGRFRLPALLSWIDTDAPGSPLPPLSGHLTTPRLDISGATLEGVEIDFGDDTAP